LSDQVGPLVRIALQVEQLQFTANKLDLVSIACDNFAKLHLGRNLGKAIADSALLTR
jgi:hypothetical protein